VAQVAPNTDYLEAVQRFAALVIADAQRQGSRIVIEYKRIDLTAMVNGQNAHDLIQNMVTAIMGKPQPDPTHAVHVNDVPIDDDMLPDLLAEIGRQLPRQVTRKS